MAEDVVRGVRCAECSRLMPDESGHGDPADRDPCPECGSTSRVIEAAVSVQVHVSTSVAGMVITYSEGLLAVAQGLIDDGQYSIAVVVAHMACEVATERCLSDAFEANDIPHLENPVTNLLNGYNLANKRNRKLYSALTGDAVEDQPFWQAFTESAKRRNHAVHGREVVDAAGAEASLGAATAFVEHLGQRSS